MYWADMLKGTLQQSDLDGSNIEDIVADADIDYSGGLSEGFGAIALGLVGGKVYWEN